MFIVRRMVECNFEFIYFTVVQLAANIFDVKRFLIIITTLTYKIVGAAHYTKIILDTRLFLSLHIVSFPANNCLFLSDY